MSPNQDPTPDDDPILRETLKRCSPATYYAACKFRASGEVEHLRIVILGVVERFVERDLRPKLAATPGERGALQLSADLGLDSLTLMEIVMIVEEVTRTNIDNDELARLRTLGDVLCFVEAKTATPSAPLRAARVSTIENWNLAAVAAQVRQIESAGANPARRVAD